MCERIRSGFGAGKAYVENLTKVSVYSLDEVEEVYHEGIRRRATETDYTADTCGHASRDALHEGAMRS